MKIKRIKSIKINSDRFKVKWNKNHSGGSFSYGDHVIEIGTREVEDDHIFMIICHELQEIVALEMNVRFRRPDCDSDFMFVYDYRQHETMMYMFSSLVSQFIEC